jgi:thioredoxin-related protein
VQEQVDRSAVPPTVADARVRRLSWALIAVSVTTLVVTLGVGLFPPVEAWLGIDSSTSAYTVGERIDVPTSLFESNDKTLFVFASGTCAACLRSRPAFRTLAGELRGGATHLLVLTPLTPNSDQQSLVASLNLASDEFKHLDLKRLRLKNVPTVVLVDRAGLVLFSREGYVDDAALAQIREATVNTVD